MSKGIKKLKEKVNRMYIFMFICSIISIIIIIISYGSLGYWFKNIKIKEDKTVRMMVDSTVFHWYISDYKAIDKKGYEVSLKGPLIEESEKMMQGYGKYHMQMQYNLGNFISYCHSIQGYKDIIENLCQYGDQEREYPESLNYESLIKKLSGQASYIGNFSNTINKLWNTMVQMAGAEFETMQDEFIAKRYLLPAIEIMRLSNDEYRELFNIEGSYLLSINDVDELDGDEFMTALLSSVYSDFWTADLSKIGRAHV